LQQRCEQLIKNSQQLILVSKKEPASLDCGRKFIATGESICTNYHQAAHSKSQSEFHKYFRSCHKEALVCVHWLNRMKLSSPEKARLVLLGEVRDLARIFHAVCGKTHPHSGQ